MGEVLRDFNVIKLVKIDAEGAEYSILKGMGEVLNRVKYLVIEASSNRKALIDFLASNGFQCKKAGFTTYILAINNELRCDNSLKNEELHVHR